MCNVSSCFILTTTGVCERVQSGPNLEQIHCYFPRLSKLYFEIYDTPDNMRKIRAFLRKTTIRRVSFALKSLSGVPRIPYDHEVAAAIENDDLFSLRINGTEMLPLHVATAHQELFEKRRASLLRTLRSAGVDQDVSSVVLSFHAIQ